MIERAMAEIITPATQPLSHSATLPEWLDQPLSRESGWVAEWLSGTVYVT